jgi:hypothetical protein
MNPKSTAVSYLTDNGYMVLYLQLTTIMHVLTHYVLTTYSLITILYIVTYYVLATAVTAATSSQ